MQMWAEYPVLLNVGNHLFKFSGCCQPYGEVNSLEVDIQIFIIKPVTFNKNVFMGNVVNKIECVFHDTFLSDQHRSHHTNKTSK